MAQKARNPGAGGRQGFAIEVVSDANLDRDLSPFTVSLQDNLAIFRLSRRFGLTKATAAAVAAANHWGARRAP